MKVGEKIKHKSDVTVGAGSAVVIDGAKYIANVHIEAGSEGTVSFVKELPKPKSKKTKTKREMNNE
jgi:hypothetical protein